jgi:Dockerin type I domain/Domain of unknown function (DUF4114)
VDLRPILFTSVTAANPDSFDHLRFIEVGKKWQLAFEDLLHGGDQSFTDIVVELDFSGESANKLVQYSFQFSDGNGHPVDRVRVGQPFFIDVIAKDLCPNSQGIFSVALDVIFDAALANIIGELVYGPRLPNFRGAALLHGLVDELRAAADPDSRSNMLVVARIPMQAESTGTFAISSIPADGLRHETTLFGSETPVAGSQIEFVQNELTIEENQRHWHNSELPEDTNATGIVSPLDALHVINFLNTYGSQSGIYSDMVDALFSGKMLDVNDDGRISPLDSLMVINRLNNRAQQGLGDD